MKEKGLSIPLGKFFKAYGSLIHYPKSKKIVIIIHGLLSSKDHHLFYDTAHFLAKNGYSTWRYNLYGPQKQARKLSSTSFLTLSRDLEKIVDYFCDNYEEINIIAHSLGVWTVLTCNRLRVKKLVFWEPSLSPKLILSTQKLDIGYDVEISTKLRQSLKKIPSEKKLFSQVELPTLFVLAGGANPELAKKYFALVKKPKQIKIIPKANHTFEQKEEKLLTVTLNWLRS